MSVYKRRYNTEKQQFLGHHNRLDQWHKSEYSPIVRLLNMLTLDKDLELWLNKRILKNEKGQWKRPFAYIMPPSWTTFTPSDCSVAYPILLLSLVYAIDHPADSLHALTLLGAIHISFFTPSTVSIGIQWKTVPRRILRRSHWEQ